MPKYASYIQRFEEKYIPVTESGCWLWIAGTARNGYGSFKYLDKQIPAHRFSYMYFKGPIPEGLHVCHSCDVPACVNPDHLFVGTRSDNMKDCARKGRVISPMRKLTLEQANEIRNMCAIGRFTKRHIARIFGITDSLIPRILRNEIHISPKKFIELIP